MMQSVLRDHPNSAKAHYVEAELLAQQNRRVEARDELAAPIDSRPDCRLHVPSRAGSRRELASLRAWRSRRLNGFSARSAGPAALGCLIAIAGGAIAAWALMRLGKPASAPAPLLAAHSCGNVESTGAGGCRKHTDAGLGGQLARGRAVSAGMAAAEALGNKVLGRSGDAVHEPPSQRDAHSDPMPDGPHTRADVAWRDFGIDDASTWDASSDADAVSGDWDA